MYKESDLAASGVSFVTNPIHAAVLNIGMLPRNLGQVHEFCRSRHCLKKKKNILQHILKGTAGVMKTVSLVCTLLIKNIYLFQSTQVAGEPFPGNTRYNIG